jgi:2-(1,2-epoxy-1,2-dihydrophenyl)acetyl-CoA isomerase
MSQDSFVTLNHEDGGIAVLTMGRPHMLNVVNLGLTQSLADVLATLAEKDLHAVVLRAEGPAFCVGADVKELSERGGDLPQFVDSLIESFHRCVLHIRDLPCPAIASIEGAAAGAGFSLAMACDFGVMARTAKFVPAYPQLATNPDGGLTFLLKRRVGAARALALILLSDRVTAEDALALGLVDRVVEAGTGGDAALELARRFTSMPQVAIASTKRLIAQAERAELIAQLARERESFIQCVGRPEFRERIAAFAARAQLAKAHTTVAS